MNKLRFHHLKRSSVRRLLALVLSMVVGLTATQVNAMVVDYAKWPLFVQKKLDSSYQDWYQTLKEFPESKLLKQNYQDYSRAVTYRQTLTDAKWKDTLNNRKTVWGWSNANQRNELLTDLLTQDELSIIARVLHGENSDVGTAPNDPSNVNWAIRSAGIKMTAQVIVNRMINQKKGQPINKNDYKAMLTKGGFESLNGKNPEANYPMIGGGRSWAYSIHIANSMLGGTQKFAALPPDYTFFMDTKAKDQQGKPYLQRFICSQDGRTPCTNFAQLQHGQAKFVLMNRTKYEIVGPVYTVDKTVFYSARIPLPPR
ncbi:hypothetical protein EV586_101590 [Tumebacillus sp. BK434]|uniref:hypothetical protein n=1 Tax=Tumebacillus sp. BK434 TaxID=2512169 RepID=UPI001043B44D|nr:hypothetical protein [Tumebacillus sp. BK434]TCP59374.1 hypothetical protein EV586_101590 [Tumebacillus sp. BK434]